MKTTIEIAVKQALSDLGFGEVPFVVDHPAELAHGDYACNVALAAAKTLGKSPREVAEAMKEALAGKISEVVKIEIAGPGFINFYLDRSFYVNEVNKLKVAGDAWGRNDSWAGKKVLVEYTDPNPFKEFHIGHMFTNIVGESLARLFVVNGADTYPIIYQGDVGLHVACSLWGMKQLGISPDSDFSVREMGKAYAIGATANKENPEAALEIKAINKQVYERSDAEVVELYDAGKKVSLAYFEEIYAILGTKFKAYFFESEVAAEGKALVLSHTEVFPESDGAHIFKGEDYGLHTRVFLNKEGLPTYEAKELALAKVKEDRLGQYDLSIISTANEVNEYFKVLNKALSFIYPDLAAKSEHIGHGMVRLTTGKMSSRTGNVISAIDFIDDVALAVVKKMADSGHSEPDQEAAQVVAIGAIKYATLRGSILQDSVFDSEKALSFEGDSGPYLQYTHARICSLLEKGAALDLDPKTKVVPDAVFDLEKIIYRYPEVIAAALEERAPHQVTTYLTKLAGEFNSFYATEKIVDKTDIYSPYKLALAQSVAITLKNGLWVLGIKAPERM